MNRNIIFILIIFAVFQLKSQDTLVLKNNDTLLINILQIDKENVYYIDIQHKQEEISKMALEEINLISFRDNAKYNFNSKKEKYKDLKNYDDFDFFDKKMGLTANFSPFIDISFNSDIKNTANFGIGLGLVHFNIGGKIYFKKRKNTKRFFIGSYYFNYYNSSDQYISFVAGEEIRKSNGFNFVFEIGPLFSGEEILPLIRLCLGVRF